MDYSELLDAADRLKTQVLAIGTEGSYSDGWYRPDRESVIGCEEIQHLIPKILRNCRTTGDVSNHLKGVASGNGSWAARRAYTNDEFAPLLNFLEEQVRAVKKAPHAKAVDDYLSALNSGEVSNLWQKALGRCGNDPEGAITAARSLVESACKHILDELTVSYKDSDDAPTLYKKVAKELNLAPDQHAEQVFKQVLSGASNIVGGMAAVANEYGDRHGGGKGKGKPLPRHARFVVNVAGSVTAFLVDSWSEREK